MHHYRILILSLALMILVVFSGWFTVRELQSRKTKFAVGVPPADIQKVFGSEPTDLARLRPPAVRAKDPIRYGSATSVASVIEFGDFECEACKETRNVIEAVVPKFAGNVRFIWRDLPIRAENPHAFEAAIFARCAKEQGRFWEAHDALFDSPALGERTYAAIASLLKLDSPSMARCRQDALVRAELETDLDTAERDGMTLAPTLFVGTKAIRGSVTTEELERELKLFLAS